MRDTPSPPRRRFTVRPGGRPADLIAGLTGSDVVNVHTRRIAAPAEAVGAELDRLGGPADRLWPSPEWWPVRMEGRDGDQLRVGADGGHGPIRYAVEEYEPGRRVRLRFASDLGLDGFHELTVEPEPEPEGTAAGAACRVTHVIRARLASPRMRLMWPLLIRPLHDAVAEDLLDRAELLGTGRVRHPAQWSLPVRVAHALRWATVGAVPLPRAARLVRNAFDRPALTDAYAFRLRRGLPDRPQEWADALFTEPPTRFRALKAVREAVIPVARIERGGARTLHPLPTGTDDEVLFGTDTAHVDVRISVMMDSGAVVVSTVGRSRNRRGRAYLAVIRRVRPVIVRRLLRQTALRLALASRAASIGSAPSPARSSTRG